jgi:hypothetical protein
LLLGASSQNLQIAGTILAGIIHRGPSYFVGIGDAHVRFGDKKPAFPWGLEILYK